jgi:adenylate cyclase
MSLFAELQRRKVFKVGATYLVVAWLAVQAASIGFPAFDAPPWALRIFILVSLLGFPVALVLAWIFEATPEGVKLEAARVGTKRVFGGATVLVTLALAWYFLGQPAFRGGDLPPQVSQPAAAAPDANSIAVLPFVNMSDDKGNEYFSDGISEEILNVLAKLPGLNVAARTSSFSFKGEKKDVPEIARELKVRMVLEGSVRKQAEHVRVTAQLGDAGNGYHLWSETYDRELKDIFAIQDEIAKSIANAIGARLGGQPSTPAASRTTNPEAFDHYLRGRAFIAKRTGDNLKLAAEAFDRAIERDPAYSAAHSGRALALTLSTAWKIWLPVRQALDLGLASAEQALRLDADNAEAYMVRGMAEHVGRRVVAARADYERARALAPGAVDVMNIHGDFLEYTGNLRGAEALKRRAIALDPLAFVHPGDLSQVLSDQGRYEEALPFAERAVELGGGSWRRDVLLRAQLELGRNADAERTLDQLCRDFKEYGANDATCLIWRIKFFAATGREAEARAAAQVLERAPVDAFSGYSAAPGNSVSAYASDRDFHKAASNMQAALDRGDQDWNLTTPLLSASGGARLPEEMSSDPEWLTVWNDPRIEEVMMAYRANIAAFRKGN